jgi:hypothetical protein
MSGEVVEVRPGGERVGLLLEFLGEQQTVEVSLYSLILAGARDSRRVGRREVLE